ncbi:Nn.00g098710.m01.CDS01 [Neocucurbitaria sp. VM-36]
MANLVPQTKPPNQQEAQPVTPPPPPKNDPRTAKNLLQTVFKHGSVSPLSQNKIRADHEKYLLNTPLDRDFTLVATLGVEFNIHSMMLIGGPKMLQEGLYPGGAPNPTPPTLVNLPAHFHPMFVDRIVCFLYCGCYSLDKHFTVKLLHNATYVPDTTSPEAYAIPELQSYMFHLRMYALAEELEYDALLSAAHTQLFQRVTVRLIPDQFKEVVDATFAPLGSTTRICKDEQGYLQQLVVVAALTQEAKYWEYEHTKAFADLTQGEEYATFKELYKSLKEQSERLMVSVPRRMRPRTKWAEKLAPVSNVLNKKPDSGRVGKRTAAKVDKTKAAVLAQMLKADENGDLDMELD